LDVRPSWLATAAPAESPVCALALLKIIDEEVASATIDLGVSFTLCW
jgi:hypothetical protein